MMVKKVLTVLSMVGALTLAASGSRAADVEAIQKAGVLRVGMADSGVMQSKDPATGEWRGFNVDMANLVAKTLGVKLEVVDNSWSTLIPGLLSGKFDAAFVDMYPTAARAIAVDFTDPYAVHGWQVVVPANSKYNTIADLDSPDVTFSALTSSIEESIRPEMFPKAKTKTLVNENLSAQVQEVLAGRADATMLEPFNIDVMKKQNPDMAAKIKVLNQPDHLLRPTGVAYAVKPGSEHFLHFLNTFIGEEKSKGESDRLYKEWLDKATK